MKSVNKSLPAEKREVVNVFYGSNAAKVDGMVSSANVMVNQLEANYPGMHDVLFNHDMKHAEKMDR